MPNSHDEQKIAEEVSKSSPSKHKAEDDAEELSSKIPKQNTKKVTFADRYMVAIMPHGDDNEHKAARISEEWKLYDKWRGDLPKARDWLDAQEEKNPEHEHHSQWLAVKATVDSKEHILFGIADDKLLEHEVEEIRNVVKNNKIAAVSSQTYGVKERAARAAAANAQYKI